MKKKWDGNIRATTYRPLVLAEHGAHITVLGFGFPAVFYDKPEPGFDLPMLRMSYEDACLEAIQVLGISTASFDGQGDGFDVIGVHPLALRLKNCSECGGRFQPPRSRPKTRRCPHCLGGHANLSTSISD